MELENKEILLQESMREEWSTTVSESVGQVITSICTHYCACAECHCLVCVDQERMKHLSWQRGIGRGTFSSFHIVLDVNRGKRFVVKAMYVATPIVEARVLRAVEELEVCDMLMLRSAAIAIVFCLSSHVIGLSSLSRHLSATRRFR